MWKQYFQWNGNWSPSCCPTSGDLPPVKTFLTLLKSFWCSETFLCATGDFPKNFCSLYFNYCRYCSWGICEEDLKGGLTNESLGYWLLFFSGEKKLLNTISQAIRGVTYSFFNKWCPDKVVGVRYMASSMTNPLISNYYNLGISSNIWSDSSQFPCSPLQKINA